MGWEKVPTSKSSPNIPKHPSTHLIAFPFSPCFARCCVKHFRTFSSIYPWVQSSRYRTVAPKQSRKGRTSHQVSFPGLCKPKIFFFSCLHCTATCGSNILVSAIIRNSLYHSPYWTFSKGKTNSNLKNSGQTLHLPGSQPQGNREARGSIRHPLVAEMYMRLAPWEGFSRLLLWFTAHYQFSLSMYPCVFLY